LHPFLFHARAPHCSHLVIHVTDFHSDTWEAHLSVSSFKDIVSILSLNHPHLFILWSWVSNYYFYLPSLQMDVIGIGGSWAEFADYFVKAFDMSYKSLQIRNTTYLKALQIMALWNYSFVANHGFLFARNAIVTK